MNIYLELFRVFASIGLFTFGGGYAMLPLIEKEIVNKKKWADLDEILEYYAISSCTPGVIAVNCATFVGYKIKGIIGALIATIAVVTPSYLIITLLSFVIAKIDDLPLVVSMLNGIRIAVCVLMSVSIFTFIQKSVKSKLQLFIFALSFILAYFAGIDTGILVIIFILLGCVVGRYRTC